MHLIARTWLTHSTGLRCLAWSPAPWSSSSPGWRSTVSSWLRVIRLHRLHDRCTKLWSGGAQGCSAGGNGDHIGSSQTKNQTRAKKKNPPLQLRKSGCSHHLGFLDQHRWQTRNYKYFKTLQISAHVEHLHRITLWEGWKAHLKTTRSTKRPTKIAPNTPPRSQSVDPLPMMVLYLGRRMSASSVPLPPKPQRFLN